MTTLGDLPPSLVAKCLLFLIGGHNDIAASVLSARSTCRAFRDGCSALSLRACTKLATELATENLTGQGAHLVNSKGCSFSVNKLGVSFSGLFRGAARHHKRTGTKPGETFSVADALANPSDVEDTDEGSDNEELGDQVYHDVDVLVRSFLKPRDPSSITKDFKYSDYNITKSSMEAAVPFHRMILFFRCLLCIPKELAAMSVPGKGQICLPISKVAGAVSTKGNASDGNVNTKKELVGATATLFSRYVSPDARFDFSRPNTSTTLQCPCCLANSIALRNEPYVAIKNIGRSAKGKLAFSPVDPNWKEEDDEARRERLSNPGESRRRTEGIRLGGTSLFTPLKGIIPFTAATYPADDNIDNVADNEPERRVQKHALLLHCECCNDFGIIIPTAQCAHRAVERCQPEVHSSVFDSLGVRPGERPIQAVLVRSPRCPTASASSSMFSSLGIGGVAGLNSCNNAVLCTACVVDGSRSGDFVFCKSCDTRLCSEHSMEARRGGANTFPPTRRGFLDSNAVPNCKCSENEKVQSEASAREESEQEDYSSSDEEEDYSMSDEETSGNDDNDDDENGSGMDEDETYM